MRREALYDLVWSVPIDRLAATFEMSGNSRRKVCLKHGSSHPFARLLVELRAGERVELIRLPPLPPGERERVVIAPPGNPYAREGWAWVEGQLALEGYGDEQTQFREPVAPEFEADLHVLKWRTLRAMGRVRVRLGVLRCSLHPSGVRRGKTRHPNGENHYSRTQRRSVVLAPGG